VEDEYVYLGDECHHLQVLSYAFGRLMPAPGRNCHHLEDEPSVPRMNPNTWKMNTNTWKMNSSTWKMHVYTWKMNATTWKMNVNTWKMNPLYQE